MAYPYATANDSATVSGYTRSVFLQAYGGLPTGTDAGSRGAAGGSLTGSQTNQHPGFKPGDIVFLKDATLTALAAAKPPIAAAASYSLATRACVDDL